MQANRRISSGTTTMEEEHLDYKLRGKCEVDTRADTMCSGATFRLLETTGQLCNVTGFHPVLPSIRNIQVETTVTAYDHSDGATYILEFAQSLFFGRTLKNSLMNPNHLHENGLVVHTCPKQYDRNSMHGLCPNIT